MRKTTAKNVASRNTTAMTISPEIIAFRKQVEAMATRDGAYDYAISGLKIIRATTPSGQLVHAVHKPGLCLIVQGAKMVMIGKDTHSCNEGELLIYSVELPIAAQVTQATSAVPYFSITLDIEPQKVTDLLMKVYPYGPPRAPKGSALYKTKANVEILQAMTRLLATLQETKDVELLAPLIIEEILIRLLRSPIGARLAEIGQFDSSTHKIAKATSWLRAHYIEPISTEQLAEIAGMSVSSLHQHFKAITSMSPLQFQKILRLQEARRLMLAAGRDASTVSWDVGYSSASQFSREYARFFGAPPSKDITAIRERGLSSSDLFAE